MIGYVQHDVVNGLSYTKFTLPGVIGGLQARIFDVSLAKLSVVQSLDLSTPVFAAFGLLQDESGLDDRSNSNILNADLVAFDHTVNIGAAFLSNLKLQNLRLKENTVSRDSFIATFGIGFLTTAQILVRFDYELVQVNDLDFVLYNL